MGPLIPPSGPKGDSDAHRQEIWDRTPADVPKQLRLRIGVMPRCAHRSRDLSHTSHDAPRYVSRRHVLLLPNKCDAERASPLVTSTAWWPPNARASRLDLAWKQVAFFTKSPHGLVPGTTPVSYLKALSYRSLLYAVTLLYAPIPSRTPDYYTFTSTGYQHTSVRVSVSVS